MKSAINRIKVLCLLVFIGGAVFVFLKSNNFVHPAIAFSGGPPAGVSGAPNETTCAACHENIAGAGAFTITAPQTYNIGQTYQIVVRHTSSDQTRRRWGFEMTSLAGTACAGSFANTSGNTQIIGGLADRNYVEHTLAGSYPGQADGAVWTFNWTAPATNVGAVTFYAAGNQANNDGSTDGDRILTTHVTIQPEQVEKSRCRFYCRHQNRTRWDDLLRSVAEL